MCCWGTSGTSWRPAKTGLREVATWIVAYASEAKLRASFAADAAVAAKSLAFLHPGAVPGLGTEATGGQTGLETATDVRTFYGYFFRRSVYRAYVLLVVGGKYTTVQPLVYPKIVDGPDQSRPVTAQGSLGVVLSSGAGASSRGSMRRMSRVDPADSLPLPSRASPAGRQAGAVLLPLNSQRDDLVHPGAVPEAVTHLAINRAEPRRGARSRRVGQASDRSHARQNQCDARYVRPPHAR